MGARVRTLDHARPFASAVAIRGGRIVAVGDESEVLAACDSATRRIDAGGASVVPGLVDTHQHAFWGSRQSRHGDLTACATLDEALAVLRGAADRAGDGFVVCHGLRRRLIANHAAPADLLAEPLRGAPALVTFVDGHGGVATRSALDAAGITGPVAFTDASEVVCDTAGRPTGELHEPSALDLVRTVIPPLAAGERLHLYAETLDAMAAAGLTGIHLMDGNGETLEDLAALEASGRLPLRVVAPMWIKPGDSLERVAELLRIGQARGGLWRGGVVKLFIDGVVGSGTAWLDEPDADGKGREALWPDLDHFRTVVWMAAQAGFAVATHAIGDRAVSFVLDAYRAVGAPTRVRHRLEHLKLTRPRDIRRAAEFGVVCGMQPLLMDRTVRDGAVSLTRLLGADRVGRLHRTRELIDAGAVIALGSDWPVAPFSPLLGMAWARLRRPPGEPDIPPVGADQCLTADEALAGYTIVAAIAEGATAEAGRLMPGMRADLTVLGADPVETGADELIEVPVLGTVVGGRPIGL